LLRRIEFGIGFGLDVDPDFDFDSRIAPRNAGQFCVGLFLKRKTHHMRSNPGAFLGKFRRQGTPITPAAFQAIGHQNDIRRIGSQGNQLPCLALS